MFFFLEKLEYLFIPFFPISFGFFFFIYLFIYFYLFILIYDKWIINFKKNWIKVICEIKKINIFNVELINSSINFK